MTTRLQERIERLRRRRTDPQTGRVVSKRAALLRKSLGAHPTRSDAIEYISDSADAVDETYTAKSISERDRIESFLGKALEGKSLNVSFAYQGSLSNNTHIKVHSDIDLLVVIEHFYSVLPPLTVTVRYEGDPVQELEQLRTACATLLDNRFYRATIDVAGAKSISIMDGSLSRKIDVVPANWLHTESYRSDTSNRYHLGIQVLDAHRRERVVNYPFAHNARVESRDRETGGTYRRLVRLVKAVRSDADRPIQISSYDIAGLCHVIDPRLLVGVSDVAALKTFRVGVDQMLGSADTRAGLTVPNGTRLLFELRGTSLPELGRLADEIDGLLSLAI